MRSVETTGQHCLDVGVRRRPNAAVFGQHVETAMLSSSARVCELLPRRCLTIAGSTMYFICVAMILNSASSQPLLLQVIFLGGASTMQAQLHHQIT